MNRFAVALAALVIFSGIAPEGAPAQEEAQQEVTQERTHRVAVGETLWHLSDRYYGTPFEWRRIHEANRELVSDPHWIFPGQVLTVPGVRPGEGEAGEARVEGVEIQGEPGEPVRRPAPTEAAGPVPGPDDRTVFFRDPEARRAHGGIIAMEDRVYAPATRDGVYSAPILVLRGENPGFLGRVDSFAGAGEAGAVRQTAHPHERLRVVFDDPQDLPSVGELLLTVRPRRTIQGLGEVIQTTGVLRVVRVERPGVVAVVTREYARIQLGDRVVRPPAYDLEPGVHPREVSDGISATVLGFGTDDIIKQPEHVAFLDVGARDGLAVGDEFVLVVQDDAGWSGEVGGRLRVVRVRDEVSSARIVQLRTALFEPGVRVHLARKMP